MTTTFRLLLAALLAAVCLPATASAAAPGLNLFGSNGSLTDQATMDETGAKWARHFVNWDVWEPTKGKYDEFYVNQFQNFLAQEQAAGIKPMLVVVGTPGWANGGNDRTVPPSNPQDYADFVAHVAKIFRGKVAVYEIWNEQDETLFWKPAPSAAAYVSLLKPAYAAIKANDPAARVAFGPTTGNNYKFLEAAYAAGAKGSFDAMSAHTDTACLDRGPYNFYRDAGRIAQFTFLGYRELRATMLANGDDKPIFLSEIGWSSNTRTCDRGEWAGKKPGGVSEADQALFLKQAFHCLAEDPYVEAALWFNNRDLGNGPADDRYGLKNFDGVPKPALQAFKDVVAHGDKLTGPCGDFAPPKVAILSPAPGLKVFDALVIKATTGDADVARMTYAVDGKEIENFTPTKGALVRDYAKNPLLRDWQGVRKLTFANHVLKVTAIDTQGNQGEATVPFSRVNPKTLPWTKTVFKQIKLGGRGRKKVLRGVLQSPGLGFAISGKVKAVWQAKRKGKWKKIHGGTQNANKPFSFSQKLKFKGAWRVRVEFKAAKPYNKAATPWKSFKVK